MPVSAPLSPWNTVPAKWRGLLSGMLQEGYAFGYLLAAVAYWTVFPHWGWLCALDFSLGGAPALSHSLLSAPK